MEVWLSKRSTKDDKEKKNISLLRFNTEFKIINKYMKARDSEEKVMFTLETKKDKKNLSKSNRKRIRSPKNCIQIPK